MNCPKCDNKIFQFWKCGFRCSHCGYEEDHSGDAMG